MQQPFALLASATHNRLSGRHPAEKLMFSGGFLVIAFLLPPMPWSLVVPALVTTAALGVAQIPPRTWVRFLTAPLSFVLLSSVAFLIDVRVSASGWEIRWAEDGYQTARDLFLRSSAATCTLGFLGLTTPVPELLASVRRLGVPADIVDLAALLYRFTAISFRTLQEMRRAQSWRIGDGSRRAQFRAASMLASALFVRCMERARRLEDGLAGRGYTGELHLLPLYGRASLWVISCIGVLQLLFVITASLLDSGGVWRHR